MTSLTLQTPDTCPECGATGLVSDSEAGEVVCPGCGLVVDVLVDRGPEWIVYEPEDTDVVRGSPTTLPLSGGGTYLQRAWTHHDPETRATMRRLRRQQTNTRASDSQSRNFHHARATLFTLGARAHTPRILLNQAAEIYRRAYDHGLIRGRTIHDVVAGSIYTAYRIQRVPRSVKELAEAMDMEPRMLTRVYRLLVDELRLNPATPQAMDRVPRLAAALGLTWVETRAAIDLLREARRLRHTAGKDPWGLAAAAIYLAALHRPKSRRITQAAIAEASGVTEVTVRNRYKELEKLVVNLPRFPRISRFPSISEA